MNEVDRAAQLLRSGGLVAFPTETVYGLGADATNAAAVEKIFAAKGRPSTNPLIVHVADASIARRYATTWPEEAETLAKRFWPGPLSIVLPKSPAIVDAVTAGKSTVGIRVPDHPVALELLRAFDGPVAAPSANKSNRVSPTTAQHVRDELGDSVEMILDGGACRVGIESTVLDLTRPESPIILRLGGASREEIEKALERKVEARTSTALPAEAASSPGQLPVHYAPQTPAYRFETSQRGLVHPEIGGAKTGIVVKSPLRITKKWESIVALSADPVEYAQHLYEVLRELDAMDLCAIFIEMPPDEPQWEAVRDRILRATSPMEPPKKKIQFF
jgi:L-threonylcarbamoyladenylate synthase